MSLVSASLSIAGTVSLLTLEICVKSVERMHPKTMSHCFVSLVLVLFTTQWVLGVLAVNVLVGSDLGNEVKPKQYLTSPNGQYSLVMRPDCNLVVYNDSQPFVGTNFTKQAPTYGCSLWMQADGDLVIYTYTDVNRTRRTPNALWSSMSAMVTMEKYSFLLLGDDGSAAFYDSSSSIIQYSDLFVALSEEFPDISELNYSDFQGSSNTDNYTAWTPNVSLANISYMPVGYSLAAGEKLQTSNLTNTLELGTDCNLQSKSSLIEGQPNNTVWQSATTRTDSACQLTLQSNGSLQILDVNSKAIWSTNGSAVTGVNWILMGNPDYGVWSIIDITNTSNILWETIPVPPPVPPPVPTSSTPGKSSITLILSVLAGGVGGVIVLALTVFGLHFYTREMFLDPEEKAFQARLRAKGGTSYAFSQAKIKQATKNYENTIGSGGFGVVYKGKLSDGREVAAKVLSATSHQSKQEFFNEIELLSMVHHKYLVSLVGFSCTRTHQVLIYEFMGGGDLRHRLQGESSAENPLSWRQRTNIVLQVAEGLEYLHDKCSSPIIHRDVKSTNILLTDQLVAKVADFGLSKVTQENATHVTTLVKGTPGYLDPEYHKTGLLTEKSDVYAFGVVLMEILTGLPHIYIAEKVGEAWKAEQAHGLSDPNLRDDFDGGELVSLVELALWCVRKRSAERPVMNQVVRRLHELGLGGTLEPVIDLGDKNELRTINVESVAMALEDSDTGIFVQQYARWRRDTATLKWLQGNSICMTKHTK